MSAAAVMTKSTPIDGQKTMMATNVPSLQVDDLLDFNFPLKTSINEAQKQKWTNPATGQLYSTQMTPAKPVYQGVDFDQMLDWKYTMDTGLQAQAQKQQMMSEQAKVSSTKVYQSKGLIETVTAAIGIGAAATVFANPATAQVA